MTFVAGQPAVVLDASVAVALLIDQPPWSDRFTEWLEDTMLIVPPHFPPEVANALLRSVRVARDDVLIRIPKLQALGIEVADRGWPGIERAVELADRHGLTVDDAAYLDLALDVDAELATLDGKLRTAAEAEGITVVG